MNDVSLPHRDRALESLAGANSELANGRYNNAVNRAYFACYQAALVALIRAGVPRRRRWDHDYVQAQFSGELIGRRKLYSASLRSVLGDLSVMRVQADYEPQPVSRRSAERVIREATSFINSILEAQ